MPHSDLSAQSNRTARYFCTAGECSREWDAPVGTTCGHSTVEREDATCECGWYGLPVDLNREWYEAKGKRA